MGLADRHYMRDKEGGAISVPLWLVILLINVVVFIAQSSDPGPFSEYGALSLDGLRHGRVWQLLTFQFLHGGLTHLLFNMVSLWLFGRWVEGMLGKGKFLAIYLVSGIVGGLVQILLGLAIPAKFGGAVVGASAGVCGLVATFAMLNPDAIILLMFVIPLRAFYILHLEIAASLILMVVSHDNVAHGAHLGGILTGALWIKFGWHQEYARRPWDFLVEWWYRWRPRSRQRKHELVKTASSQRSRLKSDDPVDPPEQEFMSREVDPILDKISAHGIQSLTEEEKKILERARSKMKKP